LLTKGKRFMKYIIAVLLAGCGFAANAQTHIALGAGTCNVAETVCSVPNGAGDTMTFVYNPRNGAVTLVVTSVDGDLTTSTVTYSGRLHVGASKTAANFVTITPFSAAMSPSAALSGNIRKTRSGSGRGGWTWHSHWEFQTLAID
jgi:hypothetical protein